MTAIAFRSTGSGRACDAVAWIFHVARAVKISETPMSADPVQEAQ